MTVAVVQPRSWALLAVVTGVALVLLVGAAGAPAICAASPTGSCTREARMLPAVIGAVVVLLLAALSAVVALRSPQRREGVHRVDGVIALGSAAIGVVGIVFVTVTLFSAGIAL